MSIESKLYNQGFGLAVEKPSLGPLRDRFKFSPFSVWNTRDGFWQERRRLWLKLGIQSEVGRASDLTYDAAVKAKARYDQAAYTKKLKCNPCNDEHLKKKIGMSLSGTSVFDPVLTELVYTWWAGAPGVESEGYAPVILDPFAGGSVRGIVASVLGCRYWGCDLRPEQVTANQAQINDATRGKYAPKWVCGDSAVEVPKFNRQADFIFSCPPYGNLERYSENPADVSTMKYVEFLEAYTTIIYASLSKLADDRFACFVVSNYRDKDSRKYLDFVGDTIRAFESFGGVQLYNEVILVNAVGTGAMRSNRYFVSSRKIVKLHQQVLVFVKGDPVKAAERLPVFWEAEKETSDADELDAGQD
jgi:hypothetical protein